MNKFPFTIILSFKTLKYFSVFLLPVCVRVHFMETYSINIAYTLHTILNICHLFIRCNYYPTMQHAKLLSCLFFNYFLMLNQALLLAECITKILRLPTTAFFFEAFTLKLETLYFPSRCFCLYPVGLLYGAGQSPLSDVTARPSDGALEEERERSPFTY